MKMTFRHNRKIGKKISFPIIISAVILATAFFLNSNSGQSLSGAAFSLASPLFAVRDSLYNLYSSNFYILKNKKALEQENAKLKEKILEMESDALSLDVLKKESDELKSILGRKNSERKSITASVILRPPQVPYDILIIDIGTDSGVKEGMLVGSYGNILLGFVEKVFADTARVRLYSSSGQEINVLINGLNIFSTAKGNGGGNFEITLPRIDKVEVGSLIITPGVNPFIVGIMEFIKADMADAFQKVLLRTPLNIQELKWVEVFPDLTNAIFPQVSRDTKI